MGSNIFADIGRIIGNQNWSGSGYSVRLTPLNPPFTSGSKTVTGDYWEQSVDSNGQTTFYGVVAGVYQTDLISRRKDTPFYINVTETSGSTVNLKDLIIPSTVATARGPGGTFNITASWAVNSTSGGTGGTSLVTGSTYPITASWAQWAINVVNGTSGGGGTTLFTGSTYPITASWAQNVTASGVSGTVGNATNAGTSRTASFVTASNVSGKVSTATTADTASYAGNYLLKTGDTLTTVNVGAGGSIIFKDPDAGSQTDFTLEMANNDILGIFDRFGNSITFANTNITATSSWATNVVNKGTTLFTGSTYPITASWATSVVNKGTTLFTASTYQITSSWANNAVNSTNTITADTASTMLNPSGLRIDAAGNITGANTIFASQTITGSAFSGEGSQVTGVISCSYSSTSSYISPYSAYSTLATSSAKWITASFAQPNQFVLINAAGTYNFTSSNHPPAGQVADVILHVSNSLNLSSSLSFPTAWKNMNVNGSWPNQISASTEIFVWLHAKDLAQKIYGSVAMN